MEQSAEIKDLAMALAAAQLEMEHAQKKAVNPAFHSKYADLAECLGTCKPILAKNGIAIIQPVGKFVDGALEVTTQLMHKSGQWVRDTMAIPVQPKYKKIEDKHGNVIENVVYFDPQAAGSAVTYARRYSLAAMIGLAQEDDDANAASNIADNAKNSGYTPSYNAPASANIPQQKEALKPQNIGNNAEYKCSNCGDEITEKVHKYSIDKFKQPLCFKCQKAFNQ